MIPKIIITYFCDIFWPYYHGLHGYSNIIYATKIAYKLQNKQKTNKKTVEADIHRQIYRYNYVLIMCKIPFPIP